MSNEGKKQVNPKSLANLRRGNPGNGGNPLGSALSAPAFKRKAREEVTKRLGRILAIIDDPTSKDRDVIRAFELLAKYAGLDVTLIAETDADGNDKPGLDRAALIAIAKAAMEDASGSED